MFKARKFEISVGSDYVALLQKKDAKKLSLNPKDRIKIMNRKNNKFVICVLDVINGTNKGEFKECTLKSGEIGIFERAFEKLDITELKKVDIVPAKKPTSLEYIKEKADGKRLNDKQFREILTDIVENRYSEIETTYFVIACTINSLNDKETVALTNSMVNIGKVLDFKTKNNNIIVDKHCIGGIPGNRTSMIVVPIITAAGLIIPKSSSRAITSPAGTADTMEVFCDVNIALTKMHEEVKDLNGCIVWGGGLDLSPADDLIIHVEHPLEIDSQGQMIASILSKKKSVGSSHVLIDIPIGKTAKINSMVHAQNLKKRFEKIGKAIGMKVKVIITDGSEPIGRGIGPLLEAKDVIKVLRDTSNAPQDLREKSLYMAGILLEMGGIAKKNRGYNVALNILRTKKALDKFEEIREFQGKKIFPKEAKYSHKLKSKSEGKVVSINNKHISKLAFILGAPQDQAAGLYLNKKKQESVNKSETIFKMYSNSELKMKYAQAYLKEHKIYEIK